MAGVLYEACRRHGRLGEVPLAARAGWSAWTVEMTLSHESRPRCRAQLHEDIAFGDDRGDAEQAAALAGPSTPQGCDRCGRPIDHWTVDRVTELAPRAQVQRTAAAMHGEPFVAVPVDEVKRLFELVRNLGGATGGSEARRRAPVAWAQLKRHLQTASPRG